MPRPKGSRNKKTLEKSGLMSDFKKESGPSFTMPNISLPALPSLPKFDATRFTTFARSLSTKKNFLPFLVVALVVVSIATLLFYKKHWILSALVNNRPVTSFEVMSRAYKTYRKEITDQIVNERLVFDEARRQGALPTAGEVEDKIKEVEERYGGKEEFDALLLQNNQTRANLVTNIRTLLAMEKMYGELVTVTDEDVEAYLKENSVEAADEAARREEAKKAVREQKLNQLYSVKFQELKDKANIRVF
ncbi:MAG: SurA N-terminal domain-containing protein [bacterium]|nr:SurA N-terminal domain-containing protein [bacterium]